MSAPQSTVVVTGASTGIGAACALNLSLGGYAVYATVRRAEDGEQLKKKAYGTIYPVLCDVTDAGAIRRLAARVAKESPHGLHGLVNNAGITVTEPMEYIDTEELRRQFSVNVYGHVAVTQALLPSLRAARGRIVFCGSVAGINAFPMFGPYNASKSALRSVCNAFRMELAPAGIRVSLIEPGAVRSAIWGKALGNADERIAHLPEEGRVRYRPFIEGALGAARYAEAHARPAEDVARLVARILAARRPRARYGLGLDYWGSRLLAALPAAVGDAVLTRIFRARSS